MPKDPRAPKLVELKLPVLPTSEEVKRVLESSDSDYELNSEEMSKYHNGTYCDICESHHSYDDPPCDEIEQEHAETKNILTEYFSGHHCDICNTYHSYDEDPHSCHDDSDDERPFYIEDWIRTYELHFVHGEKTCTKCQKFHHDFRSFYDCVDPEYLKEPRLHGRCGDYHKDLESWLTCIEKFKRISGNYGTLISSQELDNLQGGITASY